MTEKLVRFDKVLENNHNIVSVNRKPELNLRNRFGKANENLE